MWEPTLDRLAKGLATGATRRRLLGGLGSLGLTGLAAIGREQLRETPSSFAQEVDSEELSVIFLEQLAELVRTHTGSCEELRSKARQWHEEHREEIDRLRIEHADWSREQRVAHAELYEERREAAFEALRPILEECDFSPGPEGTETPVAIGNGFAKSGGLGAGLVAAGIADCGGDCMPNMVDCIDPAGVKAGITFSNCFGDCSECTACKSEADIEVYESSCMDHYPTYCAGPTIARTDATPEGGGGVIQDPWTPDYTLPACTVVVHEGKSCECDAICPISSADCGTFWVEVLGGGACSECWTSLCGSTSRCEQDCNANECCHQECSETDRAPITPPDGGP